MTGDSNLESQDSRRFPVVAAAVSVAVVLIASFGFAAAIIDVALAAYVHVWIGVTFLVAQGAVGAIVVARSSLTGRRAAGFGLAVPAVLGLLWLLAGAMGAFG